jgi:hypothetical protein
MRFVLFKEQRATAQSNTGVLHDYGGAEALPVFQAGWSECIYFSFHCPIRKEKVIRKSQC